MSAAPLRAEGGRRFERHGRSHPDGWARYTNPSRFVAVYRRYPVTFALLAPYLMLILPPAFIFGNREVWFLIEVAAIALAGAFLLEFVEPKQKGPSAPTNTAGEYGRGLFYLSFFAIAVGSIVGAAAAYEGKGSVTAMIAMADSSGLIGAIDSLTNGWVVVGVGMLFAAYVGAQCTRRAALFTLAIAILGEAIAAYFTQRTAPLFAFVTFLVVMAVLLGVVRPRVVLVGILATLLLWPTVFELRNQLRLEQGVAVSDAVTAFDRLRFDLQFGRGAELKVPLDVDVPGFLRNPTPIDMLRYGTVPRFLDPERDLVSTGQVINVALGGGIASAYNFGPVTTAYVLEGPFYLFLYYFLLAVFFRRVWRQGTRITPMRVALVALVFNGPLGWFSTFPDTVISVLQSLVSAVPLFVVLHLLRHHQGRRRGRGFVIGGHMPGSRPLA